jgi:hypothetical protein
VEMEFRVEGSDALLALLIRGGQFAGQAMGRALTEEAQMIFDESQRLVPVQYGALRSTGTIDGPKVTGNGVEVEIGYGGPASGGEDVGYALYVHERLDVTHDTPTQAKYLEGPVAAAVPGMAGRIGERMERWMKS